MLLLGWQSSDHGLGKGEQFLGALSNEVSEFLKHVDGKAIFKIVSESYEKQSKQNSRLVDRMREAGEPRIDVRILDEFIFKQTSRISRLQRIEHLAD
jgi:hypothetical protein